MQEKDLLNFEQSYQPDEDINDKETNLIENDNNQNNINKNINKFIDEEMIEPELMYICKEDQEATSLLKKCAKFFNEENFTTMKEYLDDIVDNNTSMEGKINAKSFIKFFYIGICNFKLKNYQEALNSFLEAHKIYQHYQLNYNIALCYIKLGNLENAVFYLEDVTKKNKHFFFAYYNLIKIYLKKNNINDAFLIYRDFSDIIKKDKEKEKLSKQSGLPNQNRVSITSFNTLKLFYKIGAECLFAKQLYQECVYTLLEALKFNPEDSELWFLYAKVFVMKKNFEYAIPLLKKALEIDPDYEEAYKLLKFLEENKD
jgi:tetratricopeptide (TPR) repeat protein